MPDFPPKDPSTQTSAAKKAPRIIEQIETSADYYSPLMYAGLNFYSNLSLAPDALSLDFIPVTSVKPNPKLFVVGLIPPPANISGRLLDRSGSIGAILGAPEDLEGVEGAIGKTINNGALSGLPQGDGSKGAGLPASFWDRYVEMCGRMQTDPYGLAGVIQSESGFNPAAQNFAAGKDKPPVAQGIHQLIWAVAKNYMSRETWDVFATTSGEYQLQFIEKTMGTRGKDKSPVELYAMTAGGFASTNPDGSQYASLEYQKEWVAAHPGDAGKFQQPNYQDLAIKQNPGVGDGRVIFVKDLEKLMEGKPSADIRAQIDAALARQKNGTASKPKAFTPTNTESSGGDWQGKGSANASQSKEDSAKTADNGLAQAQADLGRKFLQAQQAEINATVAAIEAMNNTPPLRLLVNPASFKVASEKIISDGNWTRNGPIIEHWGDGQDKIEGSGTVGGFFAIDANSPFVSQGFAVDSGGPGLTRVARNFSAAYHNLFSLWMLYRSNAGIYTQGLDGTEWARLSMVGSIYIYYDDTMYIGSFDSFNLTETDDKPYTLEYQFQFTVRATFLLDRPDDPSRDYGIKSLLFGDPNIKTKDQVAQDFGKTADQGGGPVELPEDYTIDPNQQRESEIEFFKSLPSSTLTIPKEVSGVLTDPVAPKPTQAQQQGKK